MKNMIQNTALFLSIALIVSSCSIFGGGKKDEIADEAPTDESEQVSSDTEVSAQEDGDDAAIQAAAPPRSAVAKGDGQEYVMNELNFEVKKLGAEVKHQAGQLRDLQAKSSIWQNPLTIYNKEIILDNGSTIFGKIVYQDEKILKVETLIGYLIIDRPSVVRIVENIPDEPVADGGIMDGPGESLSSSVAQPANRVVEPLVSASQPTRPSPKATSSSFAPNVVLVGTITETKDKSGNLKLTGTVKNIGGRRADFVKVNFVFRKDWSGNTKALTSFVKGSFHTFESGITSDASVLPGATAMAELYVPKSFGTFIGYSYTIDWEDY
ncbi:hypothetical protein ACFL6E_01460 [Candidatus Neomarinimicrobiota bacterium]